MTKFNDLPPEAFVRLPTVRSVYPKCKSTIYLEIKAGKFPAPIKLSERVSAWQVGALRAFLAAAGGC
jgi:predicted DNA-binding transcriptional regulator AlpA